MLLMGQQGLVDFFRQRKPKKAPTSLRAIHGASQSLLSINNYRNDKNKQPTLQSQCKLALTAINKLLAL
jgi:hypothetical protein